MGEQAEPAAQAAAEAAAEAKAEAIGVVLVDDHQMFRAGVRAELSRAAEDAGVGAGAAIEILGEAEDVEGAVAVIGATRPRVVLLDVHLPGGGGVAVLEAAVEQAAVEVGDGGQEVRFLALSVSDAAEDVIAVIRAGARGYVTKSISGAELADAVRRVADGDAFFSPRLAGFVLDAFSSGGTAARDEELDRLTPREREVLRFIARGYAYKEVARELVISIKTVETHVSSVLRKLQLSNRRELTRWASDRRLA